MLPKVKRRHVTYGLSQQADYSARHLRADGIRTSFRAYRHGKDLGEFCVRLPGQHNVLNTLAAIAIAVRVETAVR